MMSRIYPIVLLIGSNAFMTYAWYGHLRDLRDRPLWVAVTLSWGVAFFEYCLQVPANRIGYGVYTLGQLKILQEVITMIVFGAFVAFYMRERIGLNYVYASLCMVGAAYFMFRGR